MKVSWYKKHFVVRTNGDGVRPELTGISLLSLEVRARTQDDVNQLLYQLQQTYSNCHIVECISGEVYGL